MKKNSVNEPINILTPAVAGSNLDILSPVLSSSSANTIALLHDQSDNNKFKNNIKSTSPNGIY